MRSFTRAAGKAAVHFDALHPVSPIFTALDSLMLKPGDDALRRERLEDVRPWRHALDERHIRPYAICETPAFIDIVLHEKGLEAGD